jgi:hypothetical protein
MEDASSRSSKRVFLAGALVLAVVICSGSYPSLSFVPVDDTGTLTAGPGKQLDPARGGRSARG